MTKFPDFYRLKQHMLSKLEKELSPYLFYHGAHHTRDDVLPAIERLAVLSQVSGDELLMLRTAVLFHDAGYLEQYYDNEQLGVRLASLTLPSFGYSAEQISNISRIIMATQLPQTPGNFLEELVCDADLDSLGRVEFFMISHSLRLEQMIYGSHYGLREWYEVQLRFLQGHSYFTPAARSLRSNGKQENIEAIEKLLAKC